MEIPVTMYWNCLMTSPMDRRLAYLDAVLYEYQPELVGITEFKEKDLTEEFSALADKHALAVNFEPAVTSQGEREGIVVLSAGKVAISRMAPWPKITLRKSGEREDHRQAVRCELGGFTVYFGHITHPHEHPRLSARRTEEWKQYKQMLAEEPNPYVWFADTNTTLARTVKKRLGDVALLEGDRRTWGYRPVKDRQIGPLAIPATRLQYPRILNLDRCAVRPDLAGKVSLTVVPPNVAGHCCPSDHLPLVLTVKKRGA